MIAFWLRLLRLGDQSLWYDEGVTWMLSRMQLSALISWTAADIQPPLYYLLIWATDILFDDSEWSLRLPSVFFSVLTIPLLYILGRFLFSPRDNIDQTAGLFGRMVPLGAAALLVISPLMVYYSQEARMYTLLAFESTLASYLLLKILHPSRPKRPFRDPLLYAIITAAALYTHYFAVFLLIAHGIYAALILWQRHFSRDLLLRLLLAFGGSLLLFAPWLPILLSRLGDDPSYWPGALKLNEALRKVSISFAVGETVFEQTGWWLTLGYFAILLLGAIWAFSLRAPGNRPESTPTFTRKRPPTFHSLLFLLLWLFVPIALILILSYQSPKFNPRYTLLAWPAFALSLAAALASFLATPRNRHGFYVASRILFGVSLVFIISTSFLSLASWYTDPRFAKDDFQALAQFVRERKAGDETVLLSSGHMFPVWAYYYGWEGWTPLPQMMRLDVERITTVDIAANLADAVTNQNGVWLVSWQDEVIDPNGVIPFWLDLIGERPVDAGDFWGVELEHWRLNPDRIALLHENPIHRPVGFQSNEPTSANSDGSQDPSSFNFDGRVKLLGYTQLSDTDLALFWEPQAPLPDNLIITLDLGDRDGFEWDRKTITGRPGSYLYPPSRWPVGQIVMTRHDLQWQIGTPPGLYVAEIGLGTIGPPGDGEVSEPAAAAFTGWDILDEQGRPQRRTALLDYVNLSHLVQPSSGPLPMDQDPVVDFMPIIALRRTILPQTSAQPGDRIPLALLWQAGPYNLDDVSVAFDIIDAKGQTFRIGSSLTPSRHFNLPRWKPGDTVLGQYWLDIPPEAAPGTAALQLHLINVSGLYYDEVFPLDRLEIVPTDRNFTPPAAMDIPLEADFSGQTRLLGLDCPSDCAAGSGESITLTLYWQAQASLTTEYTVFTHLLGPNEVVLINADHAPPKSTLAWVPNEIIIDPVTITIPPDLAPGQYTLEVGLYDAADPAFRRLPLNSGPTRVLVPEMIVVK